MEVDQNTGTPEPEGCNDNASEMDSLHGSQENDSSAGSEKNKDDTPPPPPPTSTSLQTKHKALNLMT